uniref:Uncharacterized protein n=1 Tax=Molossus molossus TaxID=27622 RepID=A0A7J8E352_MOLMO|nr:hypothetical protein HJG59_009086 [Molossus molossus]
MKENRRRGAATVSPPAAPPLQQAGSESVCSPNRRRRQRLQPGSTCSRASKLFSPGAGSTGASDALSGPPAPLAHSFSCRAFYLSSFRMVAPSSVMVTSPVIIPHPSLLQALGTESTLHYAGDSSCSYNVQGADAAPALGSPTDKGPASSQQG